MDLAVEKFGIFNQQEHERNKTLLRLFHALKHTALVSEKNVLAIKLRKELLQDLYNFPGIKKEILVHEMLLELAVLYPINHEDFLTLDEIKHSDAFYTASGHQFHIKNFIEWIMEYGRIINPFTSMQMHILDILHLCREIDKQKIDHQIQKKFYSIIFPLFIDYMENQENRLAAFCFSYLPPMSETRQAFCSFFLCHIAQTTNNKMEFFEIIYNNSGLDIDHLHVWGRDPDAMFNRNLGNTPLTVTCQPPKRLINIAALYGNYEIVEFLLKRTPALDIYIVQERERTVLFDVVYGEKIHHGNPISLYGFKKIAELLLIYRANPLIEIRGISLQNYACFNLMDVFQGQIWMYLEESNTAESRATYQVINDYIQKHNLSPSLLDCLYNFMWKETGKAMHIIGEQIGWVP